MGRKWNSSCGMGGAEAPPPGALAVANLFTMMVPPDKIAAMSGRVVVPAPTAVRVVAVVGSILVPSPTIVVPAVLVVMIVILRMVVPVVVVPVLGLSGPGCQSGNGQCCGNGRLDELHLSQFLVPPCSQNEGPAIALRPGPRMSAIGRKRTFASAGCAMSAIGWLADIRVIAMNARFFWPSPASLPERASSPEIFCSSRLRGLLFPTLFGSPPHRGIRSDGCGRYLVTASAQGHADHGEAGQHRHPGRRFRHAGDQRIQSSDTGWNEEIIRFASRASCIRKYAVPAVVGRNQIAISGAATHAVRHRSLKPSA